MNHQQTGLCQSASVFRTRFKAKFFLFTIAASSFFFTAQAQSYQPSWESLSKHNPAPEWFKDAKFGIYFHWGVYSVPAFSTEWYPRQMHIEGSKEYKHHLEKYGHPSKFGYHDFIPMFKAEHFNPEEWAALFKKAGARFAGPVAEHHDGFSMWATKTSPWNSMDMGPHRDVTGELQKAIRKQDMKLITTFHHERQLQRYADKPEEKTFWDSHYPFIQGMPPTSTDPKLRLLYGYVPEQEWLENIWFGKLKEVIDNYQPDIIWFDSWLELVPEAYRQKFAAYYLNKAQEWKKEVVIVRKQDDLPLTFSINDLEKSRMNRLGDKVWMTDETVSTDSWSYTENMQIKKAKDLLHVLIDIVSKNGVLLLNISPKADGSIPDNQRQVLLAMGNWLASNGEAIYGTRPWYTYGEGPTKEPEGDFKNHQQFLKVAYSAKDIRYTTKGNTVYAITLGWPEATKTILLKSFAKKQWKGNGSSPASKIKHVGLLGSKEKITWKWQEDGLLVSLPQAKTNDMAIVFNIETEASAKK